MNNNNIIEQMDLISKSYNQGVLRAYLLPDYDYITDCVVDRIGGVARIISSQINGYSDYEYMIHSIFDMLNYAGGEDKLKSILPDFYNAIQGILEQQKLYCRKCRRQYFDENRCYCDLMKKRN